MQKKKEILFVKTSFKKNKKKTHLLFKLFSLKDEDLDLLKERGMSILDLLSLLLFAKYGDNQLFVISQGAAMDSSLGKDLCQF